MQSTRFASLVLRSLVLRAARVPLVVVSIALDQVAIARTSVARSALARAALYRVALVAFAISVAACGADAADPMDAPDAAPPPSALDPNGRFAVTSTFSLAAPPPDIAPLLVELASATDGPSDPTAYLVDLVVDAMPEGNARTVAEVLAPYVSTVIQDRVDAYAPDLAPALRAMASGAARIATRFSTIEDMAIDGASMGDRATVRAKGRRTIRGVRVDDTDIAFSSIGLADANADMAITVELVGTATRAEEPRVLSNRVTIARHAMRLPASAWFRAAFDRAIVATVVPGATDLSTAFRTLVDCPRLGMLIADAVGIGSPSLYAQACSIGTGVAARRIYARFPRADSPPQTLEVLGIACATDRDGDGVMDAIACGVWTGTLDDVSIGGSVFEGAVR